MPLTVLVATIIAVVLLCRPGYLVPPRVATAVVVGALVVGVVLHTQGWLVLAP